MMADNITPSDAPPARPRKQRRALRACDFCSQRSVRCTPSNTDSSRCENCEDYDQPCTFERPIRKRGAKPKAERGQQQAHQLTQQGESSQSPSTSRQHSIAGPSSLHRQASIGEIVSPLSTYSSTQTLHRALSSTDVKPTSSVQSRSGSIVWRPASIATHRRYWFR